MSYWLSLTVLMHKAACTITLTHRHIHKHSIRGGWGIASLCFDMVSSVTQSVLYHKLTSTRVTSPTTSSVSVCVSSPLWLSYSRSKWSTVEQAGLKRKDCCWERLTHKQRPPGSGTEMCSPWCYSDKCVLITGPHSWGLISPSANLVLIIHICWKTLMFILLALKPVLSCVSHDFSEHFIIICGALLEIIKVRKFSPTICTFDWIPSLFLTFQTYSFLNNKSIMFLELYTWKIYLYHHN